VYDEDWRGIESDWLRRVMHELEAGMDAAGGPEAAFLARDDRVDGAFGEWRRYADAMATRVPRHIHRYTDAWMRLEDDGFAPSALIDELGGVGHRPWQNLSVAELMEEFRGAEAEGVAVIRTLVRLGFVRRHYGGAGETHRYLCRAAEDREALWRQFLDWLRNGN